MRRNRRICAGFPTLALLVSPIRHHPLFHLSLSAFLSALFPLTVSLDFQFYYFFCLVQAFDRGGRGGGGGGGGRASMKHGSLRDQGTEELLTNVENLVWGRTCDRFRWRWWWSRERGTEGRGIDLAKELLRIVEILPIVCVPPPPQDLRLTN